MGSILIYDVIFPLYYVKTNDTWLRFLDDIKRDFFLQFLFLTEYRQGAQIVLYAKSEKVQRMQEIQTTRYIR